MLVHCGTAAFSFFQFDGLHFCLLGTEFTLFYYGFILMLGAVAGAWLAAREVERRGYDPEMVWDLLIYLIIGGVIGARLWHVLTPTPASGVTTSYYLGHPLDIINIRRGGLGIPGTIIGGLIALYLYARKYTAIPFIEWTDIAAPSLALGQAIGRWGNFFNQELYGIATNLPWGIKITNAAARVAPYNDLSKYPLDVTRFHPLFLYESIWDLANMFLLIWITRRFADKLRQGDVFLAYLIFYPVGRFFLEFIRVDYPTIGGIDPNQALMAVVAVCAAATLIWRHRPGVEEAVPAPAALAYAGAAGSLPPTAAKKPARAKRAKTSATRKQQLAERPAKTAKKSRSSPAKSKKASK